MKPPFDQGDTLEEAKSNITEAVELYIETLHEERKEVPEEHLWQGRVEVAI